MNARQSAVLLVLASAAYAVAYVAVYLAHWDGVVLHLFGDFFMLWTGGRFVLDGQAPAIYDWAAFHAFQERTLGMPIGEYPVPYPPSFLPLLALVALPPYVPAYVLWIGTTLLLAELALADRSQGWLRPLAYAVAPASLVNAIIGHNGFLSAALAVAGMRLVPRAPWLAGIPLGLLSYKPQLFVLVPVALGAARAWRTLATTLLTATLLVLATVAWWGPGPWASWVAFLPEFSRKVEADLPHLSTMMVSLSAGLRAVGAPRLLVLTAQVVSAVAAVGAVVAAFRRGVGPLPIAVLLTATFLFTPYAYAYDLTLVAAGLLLAVDRERLDRASVGELLVCFLAWCIPVLAVGLGRANLAVGPAVLAGLLVVYFRWMRGAPA